MGQWGCIFSKNRGKIEVACLLGGKKKELGFLSHGHINRQVC